MIDAGDRGRIFIQLFVKFSKRVCLRPVGFKISYTFCKSDCSKQKRLATKEKENA